VIGVLLAAGSVPAAWALYAVERTRKGRTMAKPRTRSTNKQLQAWLSEAKADNNEAWRYANQQTTKVIDLEKKLAEADAALAAKTDELKTREAEFARREEEFARREADFKAAAEDYLAHDDERVEQFHALADLAADLRFLLDAHVPITSAAPMSVVKLVSKAAELREVAKRNARSCRAEQPWGHALAHLATLASAAAVLVGSLYGSAGRVAAKPEAAAPPGG
jgi:chromosome segregation ATPase